MPTANLDDQLLESVIESNEMQEDPIRCFPIKYLGSITDEFNTQKNRIGKGGFAEVFLGTTKRSGYKVAIKNLKIGIWKSRNEAEKVRITEQLDFLGMLY